MLKQIEGSQDQEGPSLWNNAHEDGGIDMCVHGARDANMATLHIAEANAEPESQDNSQTQSDSSASDLDRAPWRQPYYRAVRPRLVRDPAIAPWPSPINRITCINHALTFVGVEPCALCAESGISRHICIECSARRWTKTVVT